MAKNYSEAENSVINIIGAGTSITGDINSDGDIRIDGNLKGNLKTSGKVVVGPTGKIIGEVICKNSDISGTIEGKINVGELLSLKSTSKILGDIRTTKLAIEPNAVFTGTCNMGGSAPTNHVRQQSETKAQTEPAS